MLKDLEVKASIEINSNDEAVWDVLKSAIDADSEDAAAFIKASGLAAHAGVMTLIFDEHKFPYRVPIA